MTECNDVGRLLLVKLLLEEELKLIKVGVNMYLTSGVVSESETDKRWLSHETRI